VQPDGLPEGSAMYPNAGYMNVHAAVMASWMLLLVVQPFLVHALPLTT
jgi:hypothetical protein